MSGGRRKPDHPGDAGNSRPAPRAEAAEAAIESAGPLRPIVSLDLAGLSEMRERDVSAPPHGSTTAGFLSAFAALLTSVSAGDAVSARDAANLLQLELFGGGGEADEDAPLRMLENLTALIRFARTGDLGLAENAAGQFARHMQSALIAPASLPGPAERLARSRRAARLSSRKEPPTLVQGATAAYEKLMDPDASAA